jgi:hypothetical protein
MCASPVARRLLGDLSTDGEDRGEYEVAMGRHARLGDDLSFGLAIRLGGLGVSVGETRASQARYRS